MATKRAKKPGPAKMYLKRLEVRFEENELDLAHELSRDEGWPSLSQWIRQLVRAKLKAAGKL
jgi:hypothetical protein